ncbi:hypothetical protein BaRGS_00023226 [Batillaria attramentaria]|uniref:Uncharacterized protein n=1 Tax=Batillaria attramentaria TaxID=370345 RepID=A0ABD0KEJ1_9CAEN
MQTALTLSVHEDSQTITSSDYEGLRTGDVGLASLYSTLTSNDDIRTEGGEGHVYDNTCDSATPAYSNVVRK